jgi:hypothetical protein
MAGVGSPHCRLRHVEPPRRMINTRKGRSHVPIWSWSSIIIMLKLPIRTMGSSGNARCRLLNNSDSVFQIIQSLPFANPTKSPYCDSVSCIVSLVCYQSSLQSCHSITDESCKSSPIRLQQTPPCRFPHNKFNREDLTQFTVLVASTPVKSSFSQTCMPPGISL